MSINNITIGSVKSDAIAQFNAVSQDANNAANNIHPQYISTLITPYTPVYVRFIGEATPVADKYCEKAPNPVFMWRTYNYSVQTGTNMYTADTLIRDTATMSAAGGEANHTFIRFYLETTGTHDISHYKVRLERAFTKLDSPTSPPISPWTITTTKQTLLETTDDGLHEYEDTIPLSSHTDYDFVMYNLGITVDEVIAAGSGLYRYFTLRSFNVRFTWL